MTVARGDGGSGGNVEVLVEVSGVGATGDLRRGASLAPVNFASRADDIADALLEVARRIRGRLQSANGAVDAAPAPDGKPAPDGEKGWGLDEVQLNFQMALQADAGVVIAKASTSATFSATMIWRRA
jgi:Trypsin-co-occurring domain 1